MTEDISTDYKPTGILQQGDYAEYIYKNTYSFYISGTAVECLKHRPMSEKEKIEIFGQITHPATKPQIVVTHCDISEYETKGTVQSYIAVDF